MQPSIQTRGQGRTDSQLRVTLPRGQLTMFTKIFIVTFGDGGVVTGN